MLNHQKTHREVEIDAFQRKLDAILNVMRDVWSGMYYQVPSANVKQIVALQKKIAKWESQV
jgi:hypothetical protein